MRNYKFAFAIAIAVAIAAIEHWQALMPVTTVLAIIFVKFQTSLGLDK